MKHLNQLALALALGIASMHHAGAQDAHKGHHGAAGDASAAAEMAAGEVKKIDKSAGKITLKHGRIYRLDMAPMTMVFRVGDS